jgi:hypothetical protein
LAQLRFPQLSFDLGCRLVDAAATAGLNHDVNPTPATTPPRRDTHEPAMTPWVIPIEDLLRHGRDWRTTISPRSPPVCNKTSTIR